ncbi:MAG: hypothetical protein IKB34_04115 [Clostridia bacterium]|nr:hypothetical protein [Clostridia bacterium]
MTKKIVNPAAEKADPNKITSPQDVYDSWENAVKSQRFWANLQYVFEISGLDDSGRAYTLSEYLDILNITESTFGNFRTGKISNPSSADKIISCLNSDWIPLFRQLRGVFSELSKERLFEEKLDEIYRINKNIPYHPELLHGCYLCYYAGPIADSTAYRPLNYGVIRIMEGTHPSGERDCSAILGISRADEALRLLNGYAKDPSAAVALPGDAVYLRGNAFVKTGMLWLQLANDNESRFLSASFNFPGGALDNCGNCIDGINGIALSSHLHGPSVGSSAFPIAMCRAALSVSDRELTSALSFCSSAIGAISMEVDALSREVIDLLESIRSTQSLSEYKVGLVSRLLSIGIESIIKNDLMSVVSFSNSPNAAFIERAMKKSEH